MYKIVIPSAGLCILAVLCFAPPVSASPLAQATAGVEIAAAPGVTLVQNRRRGGNKQNAQQNRNNNRKRNNNAAAIGAAVGILGGILSTQQQAVEDDRDFVDEREVDREIYFRCRHRRGFDPDTMTYVNRFGEVRRCR